MQIQTGNRNVQTIGIQRTRKFSLRPGAHIMAILSGMYKDPKEANVREYLSNMYDAYVPLLKAGVPITPPILRLPTKLNPVIEFQDFGIGMDFDTVWNVYGEYGNSTKNKDNDSVGGFGIGSKTAFCYNGGSAWNIVATKDGKTNYFQAFVGADGVPDLNHIGETEEGLPNGVTVSIPVRVEDVDEFHEAAEKLIPYFPLDLVVEGMDEVPSKPTYLFRSTEWGFRGKGGSTNVVMGNVPYRFSPSNLPNRASLTSQMYQFFAYNGLDLFVPIGAVDIVPSRDDLQYSDRTNKYLVDLMNRVWAELPTFIAQQITGAKSLWDATVSRAHAISQISGLTNDIVKGVKWNGVEVGDSLTFKLDDLRNSGLDIRDLTEYAIKNSDIATPEVNETPDTIRLTVPNVNSDGTPPKHTSVIIINDGKGKAGHIARGYVRDHFVSINTWSTSKRANRYGHTKCQVYTLSTKNTADEIRKQLGGFDGPILKASDLNGKVSKVVVQKGDYYRWNGRGGFDARVNAPSGEKEYHYVVLKKDGHSGRYIYGSQHTWGRNKNDRVPELLKAAASLGFYVKTLYGIRPEDVAGLGSEWVNLQEAVVAEFVTYAKKNIRGADLYEANKAYHNSKHIKYFKDVVKSVPGLTITSIQSDIKSLEDSAESRDSHSMLIQQVKSGLNDPTLTKKVDDAVNINAKGVASDLKLHTRIEDVIGKHKTLAFGWEIYKDSANPYYIVDSIKKAIKKVGV